MLSSSSPANVHLVSHPLLSHKLANLRLAGSSAKEFRALVAEIATILGVEASRTLQTKQVGGQGPLARFQGDEVDVGIRIRIDSVLDPSDGSAKLTPCTPPLARQDRIALVPILRAGLGMTEGTYHHAIP